jgi:hypothetical protein
MKFFKKRLIYFKYNLKYYIFIKEIFNSFHFLNFCISEEIIFIEIFYFIKFFL